MQSAWSGSKSSSCSQCGFKNTKYRTFLCFLCCNYQWRIQDFRRGGAYRGQKIFLCPKWPFLENFSTMCAKNNDFGEDFSIFVLKMTNFRAFLGRFCLLYVSKKLWSDLRGGASHPSIRHWQLYKSVIRSSTLEYTVQYKLSMLEYMRTLFGKRSVLERVRRRTTRPK